MNIVGIFGFVSIAVVLSSVSTVTGAGRRGDPCFFNAHCRMELACRHNRCTHPCEESFDEHATCIFERNTWLSTCLPGYQFKVDSLKCEPSSSFRSGIQGDRCFIDEDCKDSLKCIKSKCTHPCNEFRDILAYCTLRNNRWVSTCIPGYRRTDSNKCESMYSLEDDPYRNSCAGGCQPSFECIKELQLCIHDCDFISDENEMCILREDGIFIYECHLGYHWRSDEGLCEPDCEADTECPSSMSCVGRRCVNPCFLRIHPYSDCRVENHQAVHTCRPGYVRPSGFQACVSPTSLY